MRPEVEPLFEAYKIWHGTTEFIIGQARLDGRSGRFAKDRLISFLLTWRMALDKLASTTSSRFGKDSSEWVAYQEGRGKAYDKYFGYRVVEALR